MNQKMYLVIIALVGVGLYALPSTVALFAGQHSFTNIDPTGNQIDCGKCHGDVGAELIGTVNTQTGTKPPHSDMKCEFCHRLQVGLSSGDNAYAIITYANNSAIINGTIVAGTDKRYLIVPVSEYESGNYPAFINNTDVSTSNGTKVYLNGVQLTAANFPGWKIPSAMSIFSPAANNDTVVLSSAGTKLCGGQLANINDPTQGFVNQTLCAGAAGSISPLYKNGAPIDANSATMFGGFNPVNITWSSSTPNLNNSGSRVANKGSKYHAASLVACLDCHGGSAPIGHYGAFSTGNTSVDCSICHYGGGPVGGLQASGAKWTGLNAGGFGMGLTNDPLDTGSLEAHKSMVVADTSSIGVVGGRYSPASNAACIACHTHVDVSIQFTRPTTLQFTATEDGNGNWTEANYVAIGSNTTTG
jgi:hypothetical protein